MIARKYAVLLAIVMGCVAACGQRGTGAERAAPASKAAEEYTVRILPIAGPIYESGSEISAMAWHGDTLILVPERLGLAVGPDGEPVAGEQRVYGLDRAAILGVLDGTRAGPLTPRPIPVVPDITEKVQYCDGFEAIAFDGDDAFLQIETYAGAATDAEPNPTLLLRGRMAPDGAELRLDLETIARIPRPTAHANTSHEALLVWDGLIHSVYELNAADEVARPIVARFDKQLGSRAPLAFPHLDYRVTDVTQPDPRGRFWAINYRYPGSDKKGPNAVDEALCQRWGIGLTHQRYDQVERLVEMQITPSGIVLTDRAPLMLALPGSWDRGAARNWEGIARLEGRGVLLITDEHPRPNTVFGFVSVPGE